MKFFVGDSIGSSGFRPSRVLRVAGCSIALFCACARPQPAQAPTLAKPYERTVWLPPDDIIFEREPPDLRATAAAVLVPTIESVPDETVAQRVREQLVELAGAAAGATPPIRVDVDRGVVMLSGYAPTGGAARRAIERAMVLRGVRAVVDRLSLTPSLATDGEIETSVRARLVESPATEEFELSVFSHAGRLTLRGIVHSPTEKQLAADLAWSVRGVRDVENEIRVVTPRDRSDIEIQGEVRARIARDPFLSGARIEAAVVDGVVVLRGSVGSKASRARARSLGWVQGAQAIRDELTIDLALRAAELREAPPPVPDQPLARAVRDALRLDPRVPADAVAVTVEAGSVTLTGSVTSAMSQRAAEQDARNTVGVSNVMSRVTVARAASGDAALITEIRARLARNPRLDVDELAIRAEQGRVLLRGEVASRLDSLAIEEAIEAVPGVVELRNELRVQQPLAALRDDAMLERDIEAALWWDPRVDSTQVDVEVQASRVVLSGRVANASAHRAVLEHVREARPKSIDDRIERVER